MSSNLDIIINSGAILPMIQILHNFTNDSETIEPSLKLFSSISSHNNESVLILLNSNLLEALYKVMAVNNTNKTILNLCIIIINNLFRVDSSSLNHEKYHIIKNAMEVLGFNINELFNQNNNNSDSDSDNDPT